MEETCYLGLSIIIQTHGHTQTFQNEHDEGAEPTGWELNSATTLASQSAAGPSCSFVITFVIMTLD